MNKIMNQKDILNFIAKYTYHVLDEYGYPAKIPISFVIQNFPEATPSYIKATIDIYKKSKLITSYTWNDPNNTENMVRITSSGSNHAPIAFKRRDLKRILVIIDNIYYLLEYDDWLLLCNGGTSSNSVSYIDGIIQHDKLMEAKLINGIKLERNIE